MFLGCFFFSSSCCEDMNTAQEMSKVKASTEQQSFSSLRCVLSKERWMVDSLVKINDMQV